MTLCRLAVRATIAATSVLVAGASPVFAQRDWDYSGGRAGDDRYELVGAGVPNLLPELRRSGRGRAFVIRNFDANQDGRISRREADAANRAFIGVAGSRRDRFDWDGRDRVVTAPAGPDGGWDRAAMRGYGFRQTREGATMTMQEDVLFRTDSAALRPGALERLRPLAGYLRSTPGTRVSIVGHTDGRGTEAHNRDLSERRAASVRDAFDKMDVTRARFRVSGRGEREPVATNSTAAGMRLNRRVEVTLLGERADRFAR